MSTSQSAETAEAQSAASKKVPAAKVAALILIQGGAPLEWHVIDGVGHVHPTIPSPVGGEREPSLEIARKLDKDLGCEVRLVHVTEAQAAEGRAARAKARGEAIGAAREVRRAGSNALAAEAEQTVNEVAAITAGEGA